mmetsp:Transcript_8870/g.12632  ORF Transcript_8870/g.12632 Transcript_8870/m.12632 type:complete len:817 (-) Transcript_8870:286-2736(-)|eukprot:CAMPEP_0184855196 /NCGR_PEP_ID=MMETSP0580-20130426/504_1 /TAXON_ID=1118495 /ORGANISM="Dactyliosolen fragilissimus" /LENGTH=816 /DNA_ID=CAMNT_0027349649 /DNA_START=24 /DNA_END=2474 /DNA_ORIENTATION=+
MKLFTANALLLMLPSVSSMVSTNIPRVNGFGTQNGMPFFMKDYFKLIESPNKRGATVLEAPVSQDGVNLYIAIDFDSFKNQERPGNGGIRLLNYKSTQDAIDDAVRLAKGMTRKHDMFRTGFSGAKVVVNTNHKIEEVEREALMKDAGKALEELKGQMYTGCDLNTSDKDMDYLVKATGDKFVLAGRNSDVDTNIATASSVIGSILGVLEAVDNNDISELTFTVQGCGKVGSVVAKELVRLGAKRVQTCDIFSQSAKIDGCTPIEDWAKTPCDFLVPCANSLAITESVAKEFSDEIKYCVGAANSPFANVNAHDIFNSRGVLHVPESISSAGAILADSVEWYDIDLYQNVQPELMYGWIRDSSREKARDLLLKANKKAENVSSVLKDVVPSRSGEPAGKDFPEYIDENTIKTETLIVGGGLAGTASAFALSERGVQSVLVEQGNSVAPGIASSNGDSRMYRQMYSSEFFSKMQTSALKRWRDVEEKSGEKLLQENGLLFYGEDTGETVEGSVLGAKQVMEKLNLSHKFYDTGDDIAREYPALAGCKGKAYSGVYEETAGHIRASKACEAMLKASGNMCNVEINTKIVGFEINSQDDESSKNNEQSIQAITENGKIILAKNAVLACGPWTNEILEVANLPKLKLDVWMVQYAHYEVDAELAASIPQAFHFKEENGIDGGLYYVFPASATESIPLSDKGKTYVKVGVDFPTNGSLDNMDNFNYEGSEEVLDLMDKWVKEHIPVAGKRIDSFTSPYTMTEDSYFVMDKIHPNVAIFSGGSGRAFKFGPLLGDCLSSLLSGEDSPIDMTPFSLNRDAVQI